MITQQNKNTDITDRHGQIGAPGTDNTQRGKRTRCAKETQISYLKDSEP